MTNTTLNITIWNVRGLTDKNRKILVRDWLQQLPFIIDILMLQEIKVTNFKVQVALE
jgi:exonuclease III